MPSGGFTVYVFFNQSHSVVDLENEWCQHTILLIVCVFCSASPAQSAPFVSIAQCTLNGWHICAYWIYPDLKGRENDGRTTAVSSDVLTKHKLWLPIHIHIVTNKLYYMMKNKCVPRINHKNYSSNRITANLRSVKKCPLGIVTSDKCFFTSFFIWFDHTDREFQNIVFVII